MLATMLPSHTGDGAAVATWPQRDVDIELCWRQYYQVKLATALPGVTWLWRDVDAELCWRQCS
jgi:hypothetical protein